MSEWFHVGQKVVCVDDSGTNALNERELTRNVIYTVRWVGRHYHPICGDYVGVRLAEIDRGPDRFAPCIHQDIPFSAARFRPLRKRKTDISCFKALLNPERERADA